MLDSPTVDTTQDLVNQARHRFEQNPDWVSFFREVLGTEGVVRQTYPDQASLTAFEKTPEYEEIQRMVAKLREQNRTQTGDQEPTRVITVRMPKSLHEFLRSEAHDRHTSMNKLCISKLLQMIDDGLVPNEI